MNAARPSVVLHTLRHIKSRLRPRGFVANLAKATSLGGNSRLATRPNPSILFAPHSAQHHTSGMRVGLMLAAVALASCGGGDAKDQADKIKPPLQTLTIAAQQAPRERVWDGVVEAVNQATLSAQTAGRVVELPFDVNDYVQVGDVVVRFTDVEQQSGRRRADAALSAAQASLAEAEADYKRIADVYARKLVAKTQFDQATARRDTARAAVEAARAALREAGEQVDYTVIRAPYSGVLTERHVKVGETVRPGQPLVSGLSMAKLRINVEVPQSEIAAIRQHRQAAVLLTEGKRLAAENIVIFPFADPATHSYKIRLEMPEAETGLQPGMTVKTAFTLGQAERVLVPLRTLVQRGETTAVYVITDNGALLRQIRIGHRFGDDVEVISGLQPGDAIAADPAAASAYAAAQRRAKS
jgi:RND family efflux transporter MFP subunit